MPSARDRVLDGGLPSSAARAVVQVLHRVVHAVELAAGDRQVARDARAGGDDHGVVRGAQLLGGDVDADVDAVAELDALSLELLQPALDDPLLDLEVRDAEAHQAAAGLVALVDRDRVARAAQLLRGGQARGAGADHRDRAAGLDLGRLRLDPALVPRAVDDRDLDLLDRDRVALADLQHARRLARRGAELAGELREVVRRVQLDDRLAPAVAVDEVVPVRDQVPERAAVVAERHAALHAARALLAQALDRAASRRTPGSRAVRCCRVALGRLDPGDLEEASDLAHQEFPPRARGRRRRRPRSPRVDPSCIGSSASASSRSARL